ncbi:MAG: molybdopterin biosynthesis protein MoeA [Candidatus Omnitrophica bacterium CG11_big_fil_rev_8_21_14_0_20_42_13]|uniref:Molybdopterin molybdenumtransferase n=1 Tax=Candidatus Ghiorseimicrobium undicola TaxID=1974746 RepID=A0A2H0LZX5_9BACT|nr:MAG: molybdopterin biosynthesis protein MoeA [Candidatus Omnitrophica bacterium CG11_big_fil_rev_8_21_14_0_20_42_13]
MIKFEKALNIILKTIKPLKSEGVDILAALGRVLAENIRSDYDIPPFTNSAMDGYAVRSVDLKGASAASPAVLKIIDDVRAGSYSKKKLLKDTAIRIMTGAPLPARADSVVMVEFTEKAVNANFVKVFISTRKGENIRRAGEDVRKSETVLRKGVIIRPQEIGMLASMGARRVKVYKMPRIGVLVTGDELAGMGRKLSFGKIRNSNTYCLLSEISALGAVPVNLGIAKDNPVQIREKIRKGIDRNLDMLLISGGVSVGDYDFVKDVLIELGANMRIWKIAIRPGKPSAFGQINGIPVFGLPGNPVSSMVVFEQLARPAILKMCGAEKIGRPAVNAIFTGDFRKRKCFKYFVRVKISNKKGALYASLTGPQGSGILKSLVLAEALMIVPEGISRLRKGQKVEVQLI